MRVRGCLFLVDCYALFVDWCLLCVVCGIVGCFMCLVVVFCSLIVFSVSCVWPFDYCPWVWSPLVVCFFVFVSFVCVECGVCCCCIARGLLFVVC